MIVLAKKKIDGEISSHPCDNPKKLSHIAEEGYCLVDDIAEFDESSVGKWIRGEMIEDTETYHDLCEYASNLLLDKTKRMMREKSS